MTDMEAALGVSQFKRLDYFIQRRNAISRVYSEQLAGLPVRLPHVAPENISAFHLYIVHLATTHMDEYTRTFNALRHDGIGVNLHYLPIHLHPFYRDLGFAEGMFPNAEKHARTALSLPIYPGMSDVQQDYTINIMKKHLKE
jgi:dTDP-4-amino-4,6-dideoxygalactose transaminase